MTSPISPITIPSIGSAPRIPLDHSGPFAHVVSWFSKRVYGRILDPLKVGLHHRGVLISTLGLELAATRWKKLPKDLQALAVMATAQEIGCTWCLRHLQPSSEIGLMARRQTPPEWERLMEPVGIPSLRQLAVAADISQTTASRTLHGDHVSEPETVSAIAKALRVPESDIYKLTHGQEIKTRSWEPPAEVHRLTKRSQDAVTEMIRALAAEQDLRKVVGSDADSSSSMNSADTESATETYSDEPMTKAEALRLAARTEGEDEQGDAISH